MPDRHLPGRAGPPGRRAALAAAALAVAGAVGLGAALAARDEPGQGFPSAAARPAGPTGDDPAAAGADCPAGGPRTVTVGSARELQRALDRAVRGQRIRLRDGVYRGEFVVRRSGTAGQPITLCGSRRAVLRGRGVRRGYVLHLDGARHWTLSGFTVTNGEKGVMADRAAHDVLQGLAVHHVGHEAIHLRAFSSDNLVRGNLVHHTGLRRAEFGEGVYVGSAQGNWCRHSGCRPDRSDRNRILGNRIGPDVTAESVDLKEGTSGRLVAGNTFLGGGMTGADSWVDVKGNAWRVQGNRGRLTPRDGFQVHVEAPGWGRGNLVAGNLAQLGPDGEYGVRVDGDALGTVVGCDNRVSGAARGLSNIRCR
jgi:Right handed beta helix region